MTQHTPGPDPVTPADASRASDSGQSQLRSRTWTDSPWLHRVLPKHPAIRISCVIAVLLLLAGAVKWLALDYERDKARHRQSTQPAFTDIQWQKLVPKGWDPLRRYRNLPLGSLDDTDPKARALLQQMRESLDNAPTNSDLDGARIRILGYVVPLQADKGELREFLLVPYAGACIHTPPPPANQIIHVSLATAIKGVRTMDTVRVSGTLRTTRRDSLMGVSGYSLDAIHAEKWEVRAW